MQTNALAVAPQGAELYESQPVRALIDELAHHVRGPLAGVSGALHIIRQRAALRVEDELVFDEILLRLSALTRSMENLVDLARPLMPQPRRVSALEIAADCAVRVAASGLGEVEVEVETSDAELVVSVDSRLVRRALTHLLMNALEAGGECPVRVGVRARLDDGDVAAACEFEVTDGGRGWTGADYGRMFEPFVSSKSQHLGIGLAVAQRIAAAHGGALSCARSDDRGTTMVLRLPIAAPDGPI